MKTLSFVAAGALACALSAPAFAQQPAPEVPPPKCGATPQLPGERMMEDSTIRRRFEREMKTYGDCVKAYVAERQAAANALQVQLKAQQDAANAAVNDYNAVLKKLNESAGK